MPRTPPKIRNSSIEGILNIFPEVTWDRWSGEIGVEMGFFGWIERKDGKFDFCFIRIDNSGPWMIVTSSADLSRSFANRIGIKGHTDCKRVESDFPHVKSVHLK